MVNLVMCVTSGDGFAEGEIYAQVGNNNGLHVLRADKNGDVFDGVYQTGGCGKGLINAWDDSGKPSFDPVCDIVNPYGEVL